MNQVHSIYVLVLALSSLQSCTFPLTAALWTNDERPPRVTVETLTSCPVRAVHGTLPTDSDRGELLVEFTASARDVFHLRKYTAEAPGQLVLRRPAHQQHATHQLFRPDAIEIDIYNASYRQENEFSAVLVYHGTNLAIDIGEFVDESDVRPQFRTATLPPPSDKLPALQDCVRTFAKHDWARLLATDPTQHTEGPNLIVEVFGLRNVAVVWLGPDGQYLSSNRIASGIRDHDFTLEQCSLLGRLGGLTTRFVRVPTTVLLAIDDMEIHRDGNLITWRRCELWDAHFATQPLATDALIPMGLPITGNAFTYLWAHDREWKSSVPWLKPIGQVILTPVTLVLDTLDFFMRSNPGLNNLRNAILGEERQDRIRVESPQPIEERAGGYNLPDK